MRREIVWVAKGDFQGWACSQCGWAFNPSDAPTGSTLDEMKQNYERERDKEFVSHVCAANPRVTAPKTK
jgi:rubredoxin